MSNVNTQSDSYCVIARDEIPTLSTIVVDGEEKNLGILKDFSRHPAVAAFIPDDARLAMSWVRLEPGEVLDTHVHPIKSMIVVAEGHGRTRGDLEADFTDGDIILIPPGAHHGFAGAGDHGFWALSIQFELRGLYEDPSNPLAEFVDATGAADEP